MGLDTVGIVMRCEEVFGVSLNDDRLGQVDTVDSLYGLICEELGLTAVNKPGREVGVARMPRGMLHLSAVPWNAEDVWATMRCVFVDQLQIEPEEVKWWARIQADLGCD